MKKIHIQKRTIVIIAVLVPLLAAFLHVALHSGPLAAVPVTATTVESRAIRPARFGIGIVEARFTHRIGPVAPGRLLQVKVDVGDAVKAGQLLGEMDPVDLDARITAQEAALARATAQVAAAEAQFRETTARQRHARTQAQRYTELTEARTASQELLDAKQQELELAEAGLEAAQAGREAARQEQVRIQAEREALQKQRANLRLIAPADGLVTARHAEQGDTVATGQPVIELLVPESLWINVRFDQAGAASLQAGQPAQIVLRSQDGQALPGRVLRVEPLADAVTEELLAKVVFDALPTPLPALGELAEVTVALPPLAAAPVVPNACIQRVGGALGVWRLTEGALQFAPVRTGAQDLDGNMQILEGVAPGDRVVVYSRRMLDRRSRIKVVEKLSEKPR